MNLSVGMMAQIRTMVFLASEPVPLFWPMRSFIHHNPLHGLEKLSFAEAVAEGSRLFHGRGFLPRQLYQDCCRQGKVDKQHLEAAIDAFVKSRPSLKGIDMGRWLRQLLYQQPQAVTCLPDFNPDEKAADVAAVLKQETLRQGAQDTEVMAERLRVTLTQHSTLYQALDNLFDTGIGEDLDELLIKSCLNFFDEGQSVWQMPDREQGWFHAWRALWLSNPPLLSHGRHLRQILAQAEQPEAVIVQVMQSLKIPESKWQQCFRRELGSLHGWAGFIRWRAGARHYYFTQQYPGDLVDYLAIRLALALALIRERGGATGLDSLPALEAFVREQPMQAMLRHQLYSGAILPAWAHRVEAALLAGKPHRIDKLGTEYCLARRYHDAERLARVLQQLAEAVDDSDALLALSEPQLAALLASLQVFEREEGMFWLQAMEHRVIDGLLQDIGKRPVPPVQGKRPFVQAMFCIDTRSERLRRHLESVGDYQTFGIAGFFGVPVSFMELGKGTEAHLCPVLLTPKNLVMEMSVAEVQDTVALTVMEKVVHELKETVLAPFVTVEAIGLLFGFDMIGKTLAPSSYNRWRLGLHQHKQHTHLLIDKLTREQADSIVRAVQRALIARAVEQEFDLPPEQINDTMVRELRECALEHSTAVPLFEQALQMSTQQAQVFITRLREVYRINKAESRMQMERLGRIGFSLDEQVAFVSQALHAIGLTQNYSRFILVVGHGSQSQNNPYESALDCGACGGNVGLHNARIFSTMANKPAVRTRLRQQGLQIPDDAWFIPAMHNTTTDEVELHDLTLLPSTHTIYLDRLRQGLTAACRLCAQERMPELDADRAQHSGDEASALALRNALDWSQVRPEWGLSRNACFIIGRRDLSKHFSLEGRAFLHSYDYRVDHKLLLLENILTGPLVVAQWINMEHYFSAVDNEAYGSGSKVYHNVAGHFGVMTGNLGDLRTGLPAQTVLMNGKPYHEPLRLITLIESPRRQVETAISRVSSARRLLENGWIRLLVVDPESGRAYLYNDGQWQQHDRLNHDETIAREASLA